MSQRKKKNLASTEHPCSSNQAYIDSSDSDEESFTGTEYFQHVLGELTKQIPATFRYSDEDEPESVDFQAIYALINQAMERMKRVNVHLKMEKVTDALQEYQNQLVEDLALNYASDSPDEEELEEDEMEHGEFWKHLEEKLESPTYASSTICPKKPVRTVLRQTTSKFCISKSAIEYVTKTVEIFCQYLTFIGMNKTRFDGRRMVTGDDLVQSVLDSHKFDFLLNPWLFYNDYDNFKALIRGSDSGSEEDESDDEDEDDFVSLVARETDDHLKLSKEQREKLSDYVRNSSDDMPVAAQDIDYDDVELKEVLDDFDGVELEDIMDDSDD